jgi:hypothetical protein
VISKRLDDEIGAKILLDPVERALQLAASDFEEIASKLDHSISEPGSKVRLRAVILDFLNKECLATWDDIVQASYSDEESGVSPRTALITPHVSSARPLTSSLLCLWKI